jgi:hypothetical protein
MLSARPRTARDAFKKAFFFKDFALHRSRSVTAMNRKSTLMNTTARNALAVLCSVAIGPGNAFAAGWAPRPGVQSSAAQEAAPIPPDQLDSLVAPIALYPDPLLAQTLAASTYPLEIMQLQQWLTRNSGLKDKALADAAAQQPWDPSVQAMAVLPDVVKRLADDIQWTTDLGTSCRRCSACVAKRRLPVI